MEDPEDLCVRTARVGGQLAGSPLALAIALALVQACAGAGQPPATAAGLAKDGSRAAAPETDDTAAPTIAERKAAPSDDQAAKATADDPATPAPRDLAAAVVTAQDRDPKDRAKDPLRKPEALLRFMELQPGMRVADLGAGSGYTTELLARAVGQEGQVFAQNNRRTLEKFVRESWPARLRKPAMANVVRVDAELSDPLPKSATELDRITMIFFYHDAIALDADVAAMNRDVFAALKPGGLFIVADHHAREGSGVADTKTLHRIDRETVVEQITAVGFELVDETAFLRDPNDTRDWKVWERGFQTDRFVLKFKKPE